MALPIIERVKLFQTVKNLHDAGKVKLSTQEQRQIARETEDLVHRSLLNKSAAKAPEGFEEILSKLEGVEPDEAFSIVLDFLKKNNLLDEKKDEKPDKDNFDAFGKDEGSSFKKEGPDFKKLDEEDDDMDKDVDKKDNGKEDKKDEKKDKKDEKKDKKDNGKEDKKDDLKKPGKEFEKGPDKEFEKSEDADKFDFAKEKEALLRRAQDFRSKGKGPSKGKNIKDLQKKIKEDGEEITSDEMGIDSDSDLTTSIRAKKIRIAITPERNLVAYHSDYGPIFHAIPNSEIKKSSEALRRLANKVYGVAVYQGFEKAAEMCKAKLVRVAGVDEDVMLDHVIDVSPSTEGVTEEAEGDTRDKKTVDSDSVLLDGTVDTEEKPDTIKPVTKLSMSRRRRRQSSDVLEGAEDVSKEDPDKPVGDVTDGAEFLSEEKPSMDLKDSLSRREVDFKTAKNYGDLYRHRAVEQVKKEKEAFIRKFAKAVRVASYRMMLNHDEHPFKVAMVDILTSNDVGFSNGEKYAAMDTGTAVELTELISSEGHERFVARLLSKAADLLEKGDDYLSDIEEDLKDLAPISVGEGRSLPVKDTHTVARRRSTRIRRAASKGNFGINSGVPASSPVKSSNPDVRDAINGGTLLGRRLGRLQG